MANPTPIRGPTRSSRARASATTSTPIPSPGKSTRSYVGFGARGGIARHDSTSERAVAHDRDGTARPGSLRPRARTKLASHPRGGQEAPEALAACVREHGRDLAPDRHGRADGI